MKKLLTAVALLVLSFVLSGASQCSTPQGTITLSVFHTNDIHLHLRHHESQHYGLGDLARLKTLLDTKRSAASGTNRAVLTLDAGDWSEGNMFYSLDQGRNMLSIMKYMGYDATVLGNHDFISGPDAVLGVLENHPNRPTVLASNLNTTLYDKSGRLNHELVPYKIFTYGTLKVAVIGVTTFEFTYAAYMNPVKITDPVPAVSELTNSLHRQGVPVIILLSHNSFSYNKQMAKQIPWVSAIVSGHSHVKTPIAELADNAGRKVPIVETGQWGQFLGELKLEARADGSVFYKGSSLYPVSEDIQRNSEIETMLVHEEDRLNQKFGQNVFQTVIAQADQHIPHVETRESVLSNMLTRAYQEATGANIALDVASLLGMGVDQGPLSTFDIYNLMPHIYNQATDRTWNLKILRLSGNDLFRALNLWFSVGNLNIPITGSLSMTGAELVMVSSGMNPIQSLSVNGIPVQPNQEYTIAVHDGFLMILELAKRQLGLPIDLSHITDTGIEAYTAIIDYLTKHPELKSRDFDISQTVLRREVDLGFIEHDVDVIKNQDGSIDLHLTVHNYGLTPYNSQLAFVQITRTPISDAINDSTALERVTDVTLPKTIPALAAGTSQIMNIHWPNPPRESGEYALIFQIKNQESFDKNSSNDKFRVYIKN